jgi:capsule polysaccharide export protein KpsE/RkpR
MVKVESGKKDGLIIIRVTDKDPKKAASIANAFIKELDLLLKSMAAEEAKGRLAFLEKERTQANVNLAKAEEELRCFSEKNSVLQIDTQTRGTLEYVASLRAAIDAKEIQLQVLRQQATPLNYDLIRAETEIKGLKEKLRAIDTHIDKNYGSEVCLSINNVPSLGLVYLRLYREVKFQEGLNQLYSKLVEIARLDVAKDVSILQIVDEAKPPEKRSNKRLIPAIMVGVATFLIMIIVVLGDEYWYKRRSAIDEEKLEQLKRLLKQWRPNLRKEEKNY